jgi:serine/threonine protein kinase
VIGNYKLLQRLGDGGMGTVWMAEQERPVRRRVALKLIRFGMDSDQIIARFEAERQALAMMDHPNIARVFDGGTTEEGAPYFVMELVQGISLTDYCDRNQLTVKERLELFIPVCDAIQHAHQKGVLHRDLKPSNILVTLYDGRPTPKVIDFGLAKALQQHTRLSDKTMFTEFGQMVGTLQYMSPEQAEMNALDVDTRSDVYSIGAMLYEVLTGSTPLEREAIAQFSMGKVLELIREADPPRPSHRLSSIAEEKARGLSQQRKIEPKRLKRTLRGDLDWIVMKSLEKDRSRRYDSARSLSRDLRNFLDGDAISARPPSTFYKLRKFARKNRTLTSAIMGIMLLSISFGVGAVLLKERADQALIEAENSSREALEARAQIDVQFKQTQEYASKLEREKEKALAERNVAQAVRGFLQKSFLQNASIWEQANQFGPGHTPSTEVTVGELLDRAAEEFAPGKIEERFPGEPRVQIEILDTIGEALAVTGKSEQAIHFAQASLDIQRKQLQDEGHPIVLGYKTQLCSAYILAGDWASAVEILVDMVAIVRTKMLEEKALEEKARAAGEPRPLIDGPESGPECLRAILDMMDRKTDPSKFVYPMFDGLDFFSKARLKFVSLVPNTLDLYRLLQERLGKEDERTIVFQGVVGMLYQATGQNDAAIKEYESGVERLGKLLSRRDKKMIAAQIMLAAALEKGGKPEQKARSLELNLESLQLLREVFRPEHPATVSQASVVAGQLTDAGRYEDALKLSLETYDLLNQQMPGSIAALKLGSDTAELLSILGRSDEARVTMSKVISGMELLGPDFVEETAVQRARWAELLLERAESQLALAQAEQADQERGNSRKTNWIRKVVARCEIQTEDWDSAAKLLKLGVEQPEFLGAVLNEARILLRDPKNESAASLAEKLLLYGESRVQELPEGSWTQGAVLTLRGWQMVRAKKWAEAEPLLLDAVKRMDSNNDELPEEQVKQRGLFQDLAIRLMVEVYQANGATDKAEEWRAKLKTAK